MEKATTALVVILALAVVATVVTVIARLELDMLFTLVVILVLGVVAALILVAVSLVVRARQPQQPEQRTAIKERHTHTIDGRKDPKVHVLPGGGGSGGWQVFPDVLRGAFLAGRGDQRRLGPGDEEPGDVVEGEWEEWMGPIGTTTQNDGRGRW